MSNWFERGYWIAYTVWSARHEAQVPYWPLQRVLKIQQNRLRRMAEHAYRNVPFYHDTESLFLALAHGLRQRAVLRHLTGRLTGYREMHAARAAGVHRQIRELYESHSIRLPGVELTRALLPLLNVTLAQQVELINQFRPTVLRGYGSQIGSLFRRVAEEGLEIERPKAVVYGADRMPPAERQLIEDHFGIPVLSTYQAVEALRIGFQCEERRGFHLFLDDVAVRVVDDEGREVAPGERGHLLLSNLTNQATVLGIPVAARVSWMEKIPPDATGKTKAVVSHCRPDSHVRESGQGSA